MAVRYGVQAFGGFNCVPRYASTTPWSRFHTPSNRQVVPGRWNLMDFGMISTQIALTVLLYIIVDVPKHLDQRLLQQTFH